MVWKDRYFTDPSIAVAALGIGLPESLYQKCLARELQLRGHSAETEVIVPIRYKGYEFQEKLRIDVLVDGRKHARCVRTQAGRFSIVA